MQYDRFDLTSSRDPIPSLKLNLLYWEHCQRDEKKRDSYHFHDYWQAEILIAGRGIACFEDQEIPLDEHRIIVIPPGLHHSFEYIGSHCEYYSFKFNCETRKKIDRPLLFSDPRNITPLKHYIAEFLADEEVETDQVSVHIQNALKTLIELEHIYNKEVKTMTTAERIRNQLFTKTGYFPTADEIAQLMDLSRPHLSKKLKEETGYSLKPFLDRERIEHAQTLLHLSDLSVTEISYHLGFSDIWGFSKFFRRMTGQSPSDYRTASYR
ncbi:MAG: AraC family transcriptional regulator [Spirochaetales bacterium]|nr:AraC family transcriptional regulator [Spirochaetales bacterium]